MKPLPFREVKRKLEAAGFVQVSRKQPHQVYQGARTVIVPSTARSLLELSEAILRQAGLSQDEFESCSIGQPGGASPPSKVETR